MMPFLLYPEETHPFRLPVSPFFLPFSICPKAALQFFLATSKIAE
jgi:hypothetical protein